MERFIDYYRALVIDRGDGGGGGSATLIDKNIAENGTFKASDDNADGYSKVVVDVPNSYSAADEGKVVSDGTLVSQTSRNITANGTVDTTLNDSVNVAVAPDLQSKSVSYSQNGSYTVEPDQDKDGLSSVAIVVATPALVEWKDVNLIDYDGTTLYSYTTAEFLALTEMPANPSHAGLVAEGWNWSLSDAKTYVTKNRRLIIGQTYITDDNKTRLYITVDANKPKRRLGVGLNGTTTVDWGDGSATETLTGSMPQSTVFLTHTYAHAGDYVITMTAPANTLRFNGTNQMSYLLREDDSSQVTYKRSVVTNLHKIELGKNVYLSDYALMGVQGVQTITIPKGTQFLGSTGYTFSAISILQAVVLPESQYDYRIGPFAFSGCSLLSKVSLAKHTVVGSSAFNSCVSLQEVTLVGGMTAAILNSDDRCVSMITAPVTSDGTTMIACSNLNSLRYLWLPEGVTTIPQNAISSSTMLLDLPLPSTLTTIGSNFCQYCSGLTSITIPSGVTSIGGYSFRSCADLVVVKMLGTTPPAIESTTFNSTTCKFEVPYSEDHSVLAAYQTASNWSSLASRIVEAPAP